MMEDREDIWAGDYLGRAREAQLIEQFLVREASLLRKHQRHTSFVLAIDAQYGSGKSWFLKRLQRQLAQSHPVAVVDAWADDANDEPLVSFMAAIDLALKPYTSRSSKVRDVAAKAWYSVLPVAGKLFVGGTTKLAQRTVGEDAVDQLKDVWDDAAERLHTDAKLDDGEVAKVVEDAFEETAKAVESLVDRRGAAMLAAYRQRVQSKTTFRKRMVQLVDAVDHSEMGIRAPLFVIIDELDRCRPNYAIKILEEIKHFFEVPGVVFIIAIHNEPLLESIKAVYGNNFPSEHYLRRFFSRTYRLRQLSITELARTTFEATGLPTQLFSFPNISNPEIQGNQTPGSFIGQTLNDLNITAREVPQCIDAIRVFSMQWQKNVPIELGLLVAYTVAFIRKCKLDDIWTNSKTNTILNAPGNNFSPSNGTMRFSDLIAAYGASVYRPLHEMALTGNHSTASAYVAYRMYREYQDIYGAQFDGKPSFSTHRNYKDKLEDISDFIEI